MEKFTIEELKVGMSFTKPLLDEEGNPLLPADTPLVNDDIIEFRKRGYIEIYCFGKAIQNDDDLFEIEDISANEPVNEILVLELIRIPILIGKNR